MRIRYVLFMLAVIFGSALAPISAFANSTPVIMEAEPGLSIAPVEKTPVSVTGQYLEFDMREGNGNVARVKASYQMKNTANDVVEQTMLFPFVTSYRRDFLDNVKITAGGEPVEFKVFRLQDMPYEGRLTINYKDGANQELAAALAVDQIISALNQSEYTPQNFSLDQLVTIYTLYLPWEEKPYQAELSFKLNPDRHKLLTTDNITSISYNRDGTGNLGAWGPAKNETVTREKAYLAVLGEDGENRAELKALTGQEVRVEDD